MPEATDQIQNLEPGTRFWFGGDYQTLPSEWVVLYRDDEIGMTRCDSDVHEESWFFGNVTVDLLGNDAKATT